MTLLPPKEKALVITHNVITYWHETVHLDMFFFLQCHEKLLARIAKIF